MVAAIFLEMLMPTLGGFTFVALGFAIASVYMGFIGSPSFGWLIAACNLGLFPLTLYVGVVFLKRSPLIHLSTLEGSTQNSPDALPLTALLGQEGRSITPLRPAGAALIGSKRLDVVTDGKFVASDQRIRVIQVVGNRIIVEALVLEKEQEKEQGVA